MQTASRARAAIAGPLFEVAPSEPFAAAIERARAHAGAEARPAALLDHWLAAQPGSMAGELRYRWALSHRQLALPAYAGSPWQWRPWRAADARRKQDPFDIEAQLALPILITECGELLCEIVSSSGALASPARMLLDEAEPLFRRDLAGCIQALHPFADTFALSCLIACPHMLTRLHPLAVALASTYAAIARRHEGRVPGRGFPFHGRPLVSATAQLAQGLWALGLELDLVPALAGWVAAQQQPSGGYQDDAGPEDLLTTLAAVDLLSRADPTFDPASSLGYFERAQADTGVWTAYGPETPWLTARLARVFERCAAPFAARFSWPHLQPSSRDAKTGLPFFAWFDQIARTFEAMPGLAQARVEVAFIDLAGFRDFNTRFGQDRGDQVLRCFADELAALPAATAIRDGGDEFIIVGAPTRAGLVADLERLRHGWPRAFARSFEADVSPVAPRILAAATTGRGLGMAREQLGRAIAPLKKRDPAPSPEGVLHDLGTLPG